MRELPVSTSLSIFTDLLPSERAYANDESATMTMPILCLGRGHATLRTPTLPTLHYVTTVALGPETALN
eukprot:6204012-Pleurochrysis_carterae.AAC.1